VRAWRAPYEALAPRVIPLPHPSWRNNGWIAREPWFERELLPVVRAHVRRLVG
jgi:uracil-DNA glycosylase